MDRNLNLSEMKAVSITADIASMVGQSEGERYMGKLHWHGRYRSNVIAALFNKKLFAVGLFDSTVNGNAFEAMKQCLLPQCSPNNVVIMDNVAFHKREATRILIEQAGHEILWLPLSL